MKSTAPAAPPATGRDARKQRSDGVQARAHLLGTALRLFSEKGFAKTSTREIAQAAEANIAAISYYFGDKAGLYRAVFNESLGQPCDDISRYQPLHLSLREALAGFMDGFLQPLKQGELAQQFTRLHFREMLEPTGLWAEQIDSHIKPAHAALVEVLCRHLGVAKADDDVQRLAFSITGLAMQMYVSHDVMEAVRPQLIASPKAIDLWTRRLVDFAEAMVAVERNRRLATLKKTKP
ncbi:MAG: CerR family C-terminal domain-containing protein [Polaromonas sp.]|uniref:CerR family C-terminal domain-containing protein n=1 Tax=Polaromonas sp. TaxID=1869339 RepID=UPI0027370CAC|nr:CerR family C-terminal domain-containing protein [Polaromonas sp.]MDP2817358.1 CerR family C-terminal domain-containing protein [Polaromonas sp.]